MKIDLIESSHKRSLRPNTYLKNTFLPRLKSALILINRIQKNAKFGENNVCQSLYLNEYDIECINKAKDFIDANFKRHHPISEIAAYAGISQTRLKKGFKEIFGKGLYEYLHEGALLKAGSVRKQRQIYQGD